MLHSSIYTIYKNRVKTDRKNFEIPTLLSSKQGNPKREKIQNNIYDFEFSHSGFRRSLPYFFYIPPALVRNLQSI